jgi:hypothetical protein
MTTAHALADTTALTGRSLQHILRSPDTIITTAITPVALMLMFVHVFGGAIAPLAFTALQGATGSWVPVAGYVAAASALSVLGSPTCSRSTATSPSSSSSRWRAPGCLCPARRSC